MQARPAAREGSHVAAGADGNHRRCDRWWERRWWLGLLRLVSEENVEGSRGGAGATSDQWLAGLAAGDWDTLGCRGTVSALGPSNASTEGWREGEEDVAWGSIGRSGLGVRGSKDGG